MILYILPSGWLDFTLHLTRANKLREAAQTAFDLQII